MSTPSSLENPGHAGLCVAVIEDNPIYRRGLRRLLARTPGIGRVWTWDGRGDVAAQVAACRPQVVLLDLREGGQERPERVARIRAAGAGGPHSGPHRSGPAGALGGGARRRRG